MKKVLSLVLAVILVLGLAPTVFAADYAYIGLGQSTGSGARLSAGANAKTVRANTVFELPITFYNTKKVGTDTVIDTATTITKEDVKDNKLGVKVKVSEGGSVLRDYEIKYKSSGEAYVRVRLVEFFVSTKSQDFDYTVYLTEDKSRIDGTDYQIFGTIENEVQTVDENDDYVYTYDLHVVEALDYIKKIEVDLGNGVSVFTKMFDGKKYYGHATQEIKSEDDAVVSQYPSIDSIFYLSTVGLNSAGNYVKLDIDDKLYVYNADLEYIGTTKDNLPYSTKYYISSTELDVEDADDVEAPAAPAAPSNPNMGGDLAPANANDNPGTGR